MRRFWILASALLLALGARPGAAGALSSPVLSKILPRGGQRGTEVDLVLSGSFLKDAAEALLYKPGLKVLKFEAVSDGVTNVRVAIAADAPLGEHPLRIRTATGISDLRTFYVGLFPTVEEKEPNSNFKEPQKIALNVTVSGIVLNEDVDYYSVELKKGQRLTAEIEGIRLGATLFDPYVAVLNEKRFELDSSDDTALLMQDSVASILAPEDGTYTLMIRETSYGGGANAAYRLHVGTFPRPLAVYPAGGPPGTVLEASLVGDISGPLPLKVTLDPGAKDKAAVWGVQDGLQSPSPNWIRISPFPNVLEVEPNETRETATTVPGTLPVALNGIISKNGDEDWFRFKAKKGESYEIRVHARSLRSPLDATLAVYAAGQPNPMASNDDQGGMDPAVKFNAPADGEYDLRVRDHLRKGGPAHVYRVEFGGTVPSVYAHIPAYDREPRDQVRQWIVVPKGNRFATWMRVNRTNCSGPFSLNFEGLPPGITVHAEPVAAEVDRTVVVFEAAPDAVVGGALAEVVAKHTDPAIKVQGGYRHDSNLVYGPPNNTIYYAARVEKLAVAVAEEAPFTLSIVEPKVPLVQNGAMNLRIVAVRKAGFTKPIEVRFLWSPPGIGAQGQMAIPEGQSEFLYPLNANGNAPAKTWKIAVLGSADGGHGVIHASTQLAPLTIEPPYVAMKIAMAKVEQGKETELVCDLEQLRAFEGKAKLVIHGLPPLTTLEPAEREITKDDKKVAFKVKTDPKSPAGQHKSLFGQITLTLHGEPVVHTVAGGGVLRIDPPPVAKGAAAPAAKTPDKKGPK